MSASIPSRIENTPLQRGEDLTAVMPDFPFNHARFLADAKAASKSPFVIDDWKPLTWVGIVGGGISGLVAAYELPRAGLMPVIVEAGTQVGGRMHSVRLGNGAIAELGAMRFPPTCKTLFHYFDKAKMTARMAPFPNPATTHSPGAVVNYKGATDYFDVADPKYPLPQKYADLSKKWDKLLNTSPLSLSKMQEYLKDPEGNEQNIKKLWDALITEKWDSTSFR